MPDNIVFLKNMLHILPISFWAVLLVTIFVTGSLTAFFYKRVTHHTLALSPFATSVHFVLQVIKMPLFFLLLSYALYFFWQFYQNSALPGHESAEKFLAPYFLKIAEVLVFFWVIMNLLILGKNKLLQFTIKSDNKVLKILVPAISSSLQAAFILLVSNILIPQLGLTGVEGLFLEKFAKILLILVIGWIFFQAITVFELLIINQYIEHSTHVLAARKIKTQVLILKRIILTLGIIVMVGASLLVFDNVRNLGAGLLTTAGIVSVVGAFASQQSLSRLFAGLQIAFTQPIRIGDTIIVDKEYGTVEEITLSYVIIKLWDLRRFIMPTDYFISKGIHNLTRESTQLLGTIFIYADYTLPVEEVRKKFNELLENSKFWDKKSSSFQVTDIKENTIEIRGLMSAENASVLFNLRCEMREKLIEFIVKHYPDSLTKQRTVNLTSEAMKEVAAPQS